MVCKLRDVMGKRDERYCLIGSVELDEGFFTVELQEEEKNKSLKRGRGSQWKAKILVMIESSDSTKTPKRGRTNKAVGHLKNADYIRFGVEDNYQGCQRATGAASRTDYGRFHIIYQV